MKSYWEGRLINDLFHAGALIHEWKPEYVRRSENQSGCRKILSEVIFHPQSYLFIYFI